MTEYIQLNKLWDIQTGTPSTVKILAIKYDSVTHKEYHSIMLHGGRRLFQEYAPNYVKYISLSKRHFCTLFTQNYFSLRAG